MNEDKPLDLEPAIQRIVNMVLTDRHYEDIFEVCCDELVEAGVPLLRCHLSMNTLHPLVSSVDLTWVRDQDLEVNSRVYSPEPIDEWISSPLYWMLSNEQWELRKNLTNKDVVRAFPIFTKFHNLGATDYLALMTPFGDPNTAFERLDGIMMSWLSDAPEGFSERHIKAIKHLQSYIGLVSKLTKHDYTARNVLYAYLGEDAGRRVLEGQIRLGDVVNIPAIIWYSDLRDSTAMAERMPVETFLQSVNAYFNCTAGAVLEYGGEVLRFIGDAVLAVFPIETNENPTKAAQQALSASVEARKRLVELNEHRITRHEEQLAFGLGLHMGELLFGNIGVPTRIEFSVIGPTANEVCRLESLTKEVGEPVLVSKAFKETIELPWRNLGVHRVKGVGVGMEVFAPPVTSD